MNIYVPLSHQRVSFEFGDSFFGKISLELRLFLGMCLQTSRNDSQEGTYRENFEHQGGQRAFCPLIWESYLLCYTLPILLITFLMVVPLLFADRI